MSYPKDKGSSFIDIKNTQTIPCITTSLLQHGSKDAQVDHKSEDSGATQARDTVYSVSCRCSSQEVTVGLLRQTFPKCLLTDE